MRNGIWTKGLVFGIIVILVGTGVNTTIGTIGSIPDNKHETIEKIPSGNIIISDPYPANDSINIPVQPPCDITLNHSNGTGMTLSWYENSTGTWLLRQTNGSTHWYQAAWKYRKLITIDHTKIPSTLSNFPILVSLPADSDLAADAKDDGGDICFISYSDNTTKLNHEIEWFNGTSGELSAWVNVTSASSISDTKLWMYYGNSVCDNQQNTPGVWDSDFGAVWHMQETDTIDSTNNNNTGFDTGAPLVTTGVVNNSVDFIPTDSINVGTGASIDAANKNTLTWECWINGDSAAVDQVFLEQSQGSNSWNVVIGTYDTDVPGNAIKWITRDDDGTTRDTLSSGVNITTGSWMHIVGTYYNGTSDNKSIYINGVLKASTATGINNLRDGPTTATHIGYGGDFGPYDGKIDEVRMSSKVRNASWINTTYQTIAHPATFFSTDEEQSLLANGTYHWIFTQASANTTRYYWKVAVNDTYQTATAMYHFTTAPEPNQPPNIPSNPNPSNGSTGESIETDVNWIGGDPDPGDTVTYDVYFGTTTPLPKVISNQSTLSYDPGLLSYDTCYYWRIVAWDTHGASTTGPTWHFRTENLPNRPPYAPNSPSPANHSTDVTVNVVLSWSGGDPDNGDFVTYDIYFSTSFPLTKITSNTSGTSHTLENLSYSTTYYWKIIAWDNHRHTNASAVWSFTTKTDITPPSIQLISPSKGYLYVNFGDIIIGKIPIFITTIVIGKIDVTATITDSQSGVKTVEFYIDDVLKATFARAPYNWAWTEPGFFFPYKLKIIAYDNIGNQISSELNVWKIL